MTKFNSANKLLQVFVLFMATMIIVVSATETTTTITLEKEQSTYENNQHQQQGAAEHRYNKYTVIDDSSIGELLEQLRNITTEPSSVSKPTKYKIATSANATVITARLILVILICVLLAKLRAPKSARRLSVRSTGSTGWSKSDPLKYESQSLNNDSCSSQPVLISASKLNQSAEAPSRRHSDVSPTKTLKLPPGPMGLPFLGYLPFVSNEIHLTLTSLSERYGPIYQIFLGGIRVVVLNDASLVRQAFKQPVFSGRPDTQLTRILQGYGIVNSEGALWKEQRAFIHTALRKLGAKSLMNGSNGLEAKIQNQVKEFVSDLSVHASEGKPCQVRPIVARAVSSVVGSIVMNLTYRKYEEKEKFDRLIELMQEGFRLFTIAMPLDFIPIFRFLPGVSYAYKKMKKNRAETSAFFQGVADEHRKYLSKTFNLGTQSSASSLHPRTGDGCGSSQSGSGISSASSCSGTTNSSSNSSSSISSSSNSGSSSRGSRNSICNGNGISINIGAASLDRAAAQVQPSAVVLNSASNAATGATLNQEQFVKAAAQQQQQQQQQQHQNQLQVSQPGCCLGSRQGHPAREVERRGQLLTNGSKTLPPFLQGATNEATASDADADVDAAADTDDAGASSPLNANKHVELENIVARDLVDAYIVQQKKHEKDGKENYFSDQQLVQIMSDIFSAGLETVTSTIEWSILFLILNPHCQEQIQNEIDQVIGRERSPQLDDLSHMPYTEATIYEVLRRSNVVALGNAHATLNDASIGGYRIPKGTQVLPNLYGIHMNPKLWNQPEKFNPSRFIVNERAQKPDYFIPFSVGRRMCLGDVLAKMEVFLFLVGLLQKYDLAVAEEDRLNPPQVKGTIGVSNTPASFRVALHHRIINCSSTAAAPPTASSDISPTVD